MKESRWWYKDEDGSYVVGDSPSRELMTLSSTVFSAEDLNYYRRTFRLRKCDDGKQEDYL
jgi:hypothetical protein